MLRIAEAETLMSSAYDVIIIGAGHNGLTCANYLARAGLKTLVLEARAVLGGACVSEELVPGGTFSSCAFVQIMLRQEVVDDLELKKYGLVSIAPRMQEMGLWDDGAKIMFWQDADKTLKSIEHHNRADGENFLRFVTRLRKFGDITRSMLLSDPSSADQLRQVFVDAGEPELFDEFVLMSADALLSRYNLSDRLRGMMMFMGLVSTWGGGATPGTAYVYGYHAQGEFEGVFNRFGLPAGGMGMISDAMAAGLQAHGGEVRLSSPVRRVVVDEGQAIGVELASGEKIYAPVIVTNTDPKRAMTTLLDPKDLSAELRTKAEQIDQRGSMARIHLLVDALPDYVGFPAGERGPHHEGMAILGAHPSLYDKARIAQAQGEFADDYVIEALIPSALHPGLAIPGHHTLTLGVQQVPFELAQGSWPERRKEWTDRVLEIYCRYAPNMRQHIKGSHTITPYDLEHTYNITGGNIFHASMVGLEQLFDRRPFEAASSYRLPIKGYYLCGAGAHPGGGVTGAPGHNAAHRILADLAGLQETRQVRERDSFGGGGTVVDAMMKTRVGQKVGYMVARSRLFRSFTDKMNRNR
jgi:phytoene dehydrogenase-like protein